MARLSFAELQVVTKAMVYHRAQTGVNFTVLNPDEKLSNNNLTDSTRELLVLGLSKVRMVQEFVNTVTQVNPYFPDELTGGFVQAYRDLKESGLTGDDLFRRLADIACHPSSDGRYLQPDSPS